MKLSDVASLCAASRKHPQFTADFGLFSLKHNWHGSDGLGLIIFSLPTAASTLLTSLGIQWGFPVCLNEICRKPHPPHSFGGHGMLPSAFTFHIGSSCLDDCIRETVSLVLSCTWYLADPAHFPPGCLPSRSSWQQAKHKS